MEKALLRQTLLERRGALPPDERRRTSLAAQTALIGSQAFAAAGLILLYAPFRGEVETDRIAEAAVAAGKGLALPRVRKQDRSMTLHAYSGAPTTLLSGAYGILEPGSDWPAVQPAQIDLVVIPGVAFDPKGNRLGYGGGYYDRFLPALRSANPRAVLIGLAYAFQVVPALPRDSHDIPVDGVATEHGLIMTGKQ